MSVHGIARDTVVDERYKVLNRIGSGGMADVYCAEDLQLGRKRGAEAALPPLRRGRRVRRALPPRGVERGRPAAPQRGRRLRPRGVRRHLLHRDGVPGGAVAEAGRPPGRRARPRPRDRPRAPDPQGRPLRAPARDRAPRHQAPQRDRRRRGPRQGHGLRDRPRRRLGHDRDRLDHGHGAVPLARAGPGPPGRRALGPLLDRRRALRAADRPGAVRRRVRGHDRAQAGLRGAGAAVAVQPGDLRAARGRRHEGAAEGPGLPLRRRRRVHPRARGGPRRAGRDGRVHARRAAHGHLSRPAGRRRARGGRPPQPALAVDPADAARARRDRGRRLPAADAGEARRPRRRRAALGHGGADPPEQGLRGQRRERALRQRARRPRHHAAAAAGARRPRRARP